MDVVENNFSDIFKRWQFLAGIFGIALWIGVVVWLLFGEKELIQHSVEFAKENELRSALVFIAIYVLTCILLLPSLILTPAAGVIFGFGKGVLVASLSVTLGALCAFLVSRYFLQSRVLSWVEGTRKLQLLHHAVSKKGWKIVFLARLCVFVPFRISNYLFGVTKIHVFSFIVASWFGTIASTTFYVYTGSLASSFANLSSGVTMEGDSKNLHLAILLVSLVVLVLLVRFTLRVLSQNEGLSEEDEESSRRKVNS